MRDDGLWGYGPDGYDGDNPWADYANAAVTEDQIVSGWMFCNAGQPADISERNNETLGLTPQTIEFMDQA